MVFADGLTYCTTALRRLRMTPLLRFQPAHAKRLSRRARKADGKERVRMARQPGAPAPGRDADRESAGRAEFPQSGSADSPSPPGPRTAPRPLSPGPGNCKSGSSLRRKPHLAGRLFGSRRQPWLDGRRSENRAQNRPHGGRQESGASPCQNDTAATTPVRSQATIELAARYLKARAEKQSAAGGFPIHPLLSMSWLEMSRWMSAGAGARSPAFWRK